MILLKLYLGAIAITYAITLAAIIAYFVRKWLRLARGAGGQMTLLMLLALSTHAHAGWFKDFCSRHLVAEDPHPYAELHTRHLFEVYRLNSEKKILDEIVFRLRTGMMTESEQRYFWETFGKRKVEPRD